MQKYVSQLIEDAILEASKGMQLDRENTVIFVEKNVPGVTHKDAVHEVNKYFSKRYEVKI